MTDKEKKQVRILRECGHTFGKIAQILHISRDAAKGYCQRHQVEVPGDDFEASSTYKLCPNCKELFVASGRQKQSRQFCSDKCRGEYWQKEYYPEAYLAKFEDYYKTLHEGLDFSEDLRDELDGTEEIHLCSRNKTILNEVKEE